MSDTMIGTQQSDQSFEVRIGPSETGLLTRAPAHFGYTPAGHAISDSNVAKWIATIFCDVGYRQDVEPGPEARKIFLSQSQKELIEAEFLTQLQRDLDELPEPARSSQGAKLCRHLIQGVGKAFAFIPEARCAVFGDEEDGVELIAHSRASMRQVSFEFGLEESLINIVRIDEKMHRSVQTCGIDKVLTLAEAVAWLNLH